MKIRISLLAAIVALPFAAQVDAAKTQESLQAASALSRSANGTVEIKRDESNDDVRFVKVQKGGDLMPSAKSANKGTEFLKKNAALFGLSGTNGELQLMRSSSDRTGQRTEKFQQMYNGIPVYGARLVSATDAAGKLKSVNGAVAPNLNVDTNARISAATAQAHAIQHITQHFAPRDLGELKTSDVQLFIYGKDFVRGGTGKYDLVWHVEVLGRDTREFVFVSAHHGKVVDQITGTYDALERRIYDGGFGSGFQVWSEGDSFPTGTTSWDELIAYTEDTYNLYSSMTNGSYLSFTGTDSIMHAVNNDPAISCPNAQFTGSYIRFCDGTSTDDVVGHEWSHGYTQETHGLIYQYQSGAMNEAYSDIFGEVVDFLNGAGNDTPGGVRAVGGCSVFGGSALPVFTVNAPGSVAGTYEVQGAGFNPGGAVSVTDDLELASPANGCTAIAGNVSGNIAIIDRGGCPFVDKVSNAQNAGATGVIVVNNVATAPISMGGAGSFSIPSVMMSQAEGTTLKAATGANATITLTASTQNSYRWLVGEDSAAFGGSIRDMRNPTCFGDPAKVSSALYACDPDLTDAGGVHSNSGIINFGFSLLVDGGNANGQSINAIGLTKATNIYWRSMEIYQTPTSGYSDHGSALSQSCTDLIGQNLRTLSTNQALTGLSGEVINAADCAEVDKLVPALDLNAQPLICNFQPLLAQNPPAPCGTGESQNFALEQNFESGLGGWTVGSRAIVNPATFDVPQWAISSNLPFGVAGQAAFGADPIIGDCNTDIEAGINYLQSPSFTVGADAKLSFDHSVATEANWDGGNIKASVNGGSYTLIPSSAFIYNAYVGPLNAGDNPMAGEAAWHGTDGGSFSGAWGESQLNLSGIASDGDQVVLRFEMGTDGCNGSTGWFVDNVQAYSCEVGGVDSDGDGVTDNIDNCTTVANASQKDSNGDGFGNACDPDTNNDCIINFLDVGQFSSNIFGSNADFDFNGDGGVNFLDYPTLTSRIFGQPGPSALASCDN